MGKSHSISRNSEKQKILDTVAKKNAEFEKWAKNILGIKDSVKSLNSATGLSEIENQSHLVLENIMKFHEGIQNKEVEFEGYVKTGMVFQKDLNWDIPNSLKIFEHYWNKVSGSNDKNSDEKIFPLFSKEEGKEVNFVLLKLKFL